MSPGFRLVKGLHLLNSYGSLVAPVLINVFNLVVLRGFFQSVPEELYEAARLDGASEWLILRRIVLPQAMRAIVPPAGNMLIGTLKGTSIVSIIAVQDLLYSVQLVYHRTYQVIPLLLVATLWYVVVTSLLSVGQHYVERHYARGTADAR